MPSSLLKLVTKALDSLSVISIDNCDTFSLFVVRILKNGHAVATALKGNDKKSSFGFYRLLKEKGSPLALGIELLVFKTHKKREGPFQMA